jgi:signal transduction histidine kinase
MTARVRPTATRRGLAALNRLLIEAQERERTWLARELHDDIGQQIMVLSLDIARLRETLRGSSADADARALTRAVSDRLVALGRDVNRLSHRLHSSKLEYVGLAAAARNFCAEISTQHRAEIDYAQEGVPDDLPGHIALTMFRVLQEALTNAVKHSGATRYTVALRGTAEDVTLDVVDNGCGFDPESALAGHGLGLVSIQERLSMVNGEAIVESAAGRGTRICAWAPRQRMAGRLADLKSSAADQKSFPVNLAGTSAIETRPRPEAR